MASRLFTLEGGNEEKRGEFAEIIRERLMRELGSQFPTERGYQADWDEGRDLLSISRGSWWGLEVNLVARNLDCTRWECRFNAYFPTVRRVTRSLERIIPEPPERFAGRLVWGHLFFSLFLIPVVIALPLIVIYRITLLPLARDVSAAARRLDELWPSLRGLWPGELPVLKDGAPLLTLLKFMLAAGAAAAACYWLGGLPGMNEGWSIAIYFVGILLAVFSVVCFIGLVLGALGFEIRH